MNRAADSTSAYCDSVDDHMASVRGVQRRAIPVVHSGRTAEAQEPEMNNDHLSRRSITQPHSGEKFHHCFARRKGSSAADAAGGERKWSISERDNASPDGLV